MGTIVQWIDGKTAKHSIELPDMDSCDKLGTREKLLGRVPSIDICSFDSAKNGECIALYNTLYNGHMWEYWDSRDNLETWANHRGIKTLNGGNLTAENLVYIFGESSPVTRAFFVRWHDDNDDASAYNQYRDLIAVFPDVRENKADDVTYYVHSGGHSSVSLAAAIERYNTNPEDADVKRLADELRAYPYDYRLHIMTAEEIAILREKLASIERVRNGD